MSTAQQPGALDRIRRARSTLSEAEARACDALIADAAAPEALTIAGLAERAIVSPATVTRLCRRLGFASFQAVRLALVAEAARREPDRPAGDAPHGAARALTLTARAYQEVLRETAAGIDPALITSIGRQLRAAARISAFGIGGSAAVAADLCHKLGKLGLAAAAQGDGDMMTIAAAAARPGHVLIGISHTGRAESVVTALRRGRARGATVIAVTCDAASPIAAAADLLVITASRHTDLPTDELSGRIAQLLVFDAVYSLLALEDLAAGRSGLSDVTAAFDSQRLR